MTDKDWDAYVTANGEIAQETPKPQLLTKADVDPDTGLIDADKIEVYTTHISHLSYPSTCSLALIIEIFYTNSLSTHIISIDDSI
jgi:hypothetical protein